MVVPFHKCIQISVFYVFLEHKDLHQSQKKKIESQQREIENLEKQNEEQRLKIVKILERPKTEPLGALECTICAEEYVEPHLPTRFAKFGVIPIYLIITSVRPNSIITHELGYNFGRQCSTGTLD